MKKNQFLLAFLIFFIPGSLVFSDPLPFDFTFYGLYGAPTQPNFLATSNYDGLGFGGLLEWNPSYYASLGLSYETVTFYGSPNFSAGSLNAEGKFFLAAFLQNYSPYISAGAGFNLLPSVGNWQGSFGLKVGVGDRVQFGGPLFIDLGFDYHWMTSGSNSFQYADARTGLGYAFDISGEPAPSPTPVGTSSPVASPSPMTTVTRVSTPTSTRTTILFTATPTETSTLNLTPVETVIISITPTPTPEMEIEAEPTPSATETSPVLSKMRKYYRLGVKAFEQRRYTAAVADLQLSLTYQDPTIPSFYYAEADATLGVIYQFHRKTPGHLKLAKKYYKKALKIDPETKAAKHYLPTLMALPTPRPKIDTASDSTSSAVSTDSAGNSTGNSSRTTTGN